MKLIATTVVRGSQPGESHGGAWLIDLDAHTVDKTIDWSSFEIDWRGHGGGRGLRGVAFDGERVYIAASEQLFAYGPDFELEDCWRNPYLKNCHEIVVYQRTLFLASTAFDCILAFDLDNLRFARSFHIETSNFRFKASPFDTDSGDGPLELNKLHINSVACNRHGMYIGGLNTGGMLHFNGRSVSMAAELPGGSHNARPFRNGVLFNDNEAGRLRYCGRDDGDEDRSMAPPHYDPKSLLAADAENERIARQGFVRGLCALSDSVVAAGSSPATVSVHDLAANERIGSVNLSRDLRAAVHGLGVWPYS